MMRSLVVAVNRSGVRGLTQRDYDQLCLASGLDRRPQRAIRRRYEASDHLYLGAGKLGPVFRADARVDAPSAEYL